MANFVRPKIIHSSKVQRELLDRLSRVAKTTAEVLITGPSGVGKELYAAYVHAKSDRVHRPFVVVNCANLTGEMLENEIFGHAKGAFTGAVSSTNGIAAAADGGTLFLDEIEALSIECQAKILRFTQLKEYRRLGDTFVRKSDVRLITASNANLISMVHDGKFREDLYFRLRVVPVEIPPLADRPSDISPLLEHFSDHYADEYGLPSISLTPNAHKKLNSYSWPGNVRELENCIRYLTCLGFKRPVRAQDLPLLEQEPPLNSSVFDAGQEGPTLHKIKMSEGEEGMTNVPLKEAKSMVVEAFERLYIDSALRRSKGNISAAARNSGKHRRAFFELMRRYGICAGTYRRG